ncbi:MBL fold metallo-hydrolase [Acetobacter musti]|uniref:MBL fold metallo-hydrolase n=1 Tax=Acetobacter musti TaxID=864732 RepID=A0ABX0JKI7_9PROT|nr:MBL fold metallo-hydrolase [Acetobacter musti]NHN83293.1 MBL fold metallo-hydrolase [Acetobacter musti]
MSNVCRFEVERIPVTPFHQNCSLVWCPQTKHAFIVDPGGDVETIMERVEASDLTVDAILLTHGHLDHAGGAGQLRSALEARQGKGSVKLIGPSREDEFLLNSIETQAAHFGLNDLKNARPDEYTADGDTLTLLGRTYSVSHVPGHTPGHVVFFDRQDGVLFAGDTLFRGTVGRTDFPYGNGKQLIDSIVEKILPLGDDVVVLPGHGAPTTIGIERESNPFLR